MRTPGTARQRLARAWRSGVGLVSSEGHADVDEDSRSHVVAKRVAAARSGPTPPAVLRRRGECPDRDGVVGAVAGRRPLAPHRYATTERSCRLDARDHHAVSGAAFVHVWIPVDGVPALDEPAAAAGPALSAGR